METYNIPKKVAITWFIATLMLLAFAIIGVQSVKSMSNRAATHLNEITHLEDSICAIYKEANTQIKRVAPEGKYRIGDLYIEIESHNNYREIYSNVKEITSKMCK